VAKEHGLMVLGSLWILAEAKRLGIIEQAKPLLDAMLAAAYWIGEDLVPPFLQEVGENISS
jgi:predicted nucleic acid-binding protein